MRPRSKKAIAASLKIQKALVASLGAEQRADVPEYDRDYYWLETKAGLMRIGLMDDAGWIHCRFEDVEKAKTILGSVWGNRLNPYSGKWNWHWHSEAEAETLKAFEREVRWLIDAPQ